MRRRLLPLVWICLGAWAFAGAAAAQTPDYGGDGLAGGPESRRSYGDPSYPTPARPSGKRPGSLEHERAGLHEADGRWPRVEPGYEQVGAASWYGEDFHGQRTASGERFDPTAMTAAHPTLPIHSLVRVTNLANGRDVIVRVNDRGPFESSRLIDVSRAAAEELGFVRAGHARVRVRYLGPAPDRGGEDWSGHDTGNGRPGRGEYVVQIGAYAEFRNARRARATVAADAWPVVVDTRPGRYRGLFLIRVGPWASRREALEVQGRLRELGYRDAFVTTR